MENIITRIIKYIAGPNILDFKALGITTKDRYHDLRDEGFVEDAIGHNKKILFELGLSEADYNGLMGTLSEYVNNIGFKDKFNIRGLTTPIYLTHPILKNLGCLWVTCVQKSECYEADLSTKAHEETHILHGIGKLNLLEEKIQKTIPEFNFKWAPDYNQGKENEEEAKFSEYIAAIGSCYALNSRNIPLSKAITSKVNPSVIKAFYDYQNLLIGGKVRLGI